jgi:hypothetical protein
MAIGYLNCYNHYKLLILTTILLLSINKSVAQTTENYSLLKKEYEGTWYNKESKHYISITFDTEVDYLTTGSVSITTSILMLTRHIPKAIN